MFLICKRAKYWNWYIPRLLLIITLRLACGEKKSCLSTKNSQNIMSIIVAFIIPLQQKHEDPTKKAYLGLCQPLCWSLILKIWSWKNKYWTVPNYSLLHLFLVQVLVFTTQKMKFSMKDFYSFLFRFIRTYQYTKKCLCLSKYDAKNINFWHYLDLKDGSLT